MLWAKNNKQQITTTKSMQAKPAAKTVKMMNPIELVVKFNHVVHGHATPNLDGQKDKV